MPTIVELKVKFVLYTKSIWGEHYNGDCKIIVSIFTEQKRGSYLGVQNQTIHFNTHPVHWKHFIPIIIGQ